VVFFLKENNYVDKVNTYFILKIHGWLTRLIHTLSPRSMDGFGRPLVEHWPY